MQGVNYAILPNERKMKKSVGAQSVRNSFYEPESHHEAYLTDYSGVYIDDYFGIRFSDARHEVDRQARQRPLLE